MPKLLKIKSQRPPHRLVAISIPAWMHEYFTLYCVAKGITKADIIRPFLDSWLEEMRSTFNDPVLIDEVVEKCNEKRIMYYEELPFNDFIKIIKDELRKGGLKETYVEAVIKQIIE